MYKIVIVGAGPIGCYLARRLQSKGINPLLLEEHKSIGRPIHCAGLVGEKVFKETKVPIIDKCILNKINGAIIHLGSQELQLHKNKVAYVVDRESFDKNLGKGLKVLFETKFLGLEKENNHYIIETDKGELKADLVIGADGANSLVREFVNGSPRINYLKGVQFRMASKPRKKDLVEVYVDKPYFYWIVPESDKIIRVGVLSQNPYRDLSSFVKRNKIDGKIIEKFAGRVPLTHHKALSRERVFLVGDSASQIKPLTYGGIYMGMQGAEILLNCILNKRFQDYSSLWIKRFGRELRISLRTREVFQRLTEEDLKKMFALAKRNASMIEEKGDFERHASLVWEFLRNPLNRKELTAIIFKLFKASLRENLIYS